MIDHFADLESDLDDAPVAEPTRQTYPCMHCNGTGRWSSPTGGKCHTCNGRGHFLTSPADRMKRKHAAHTKKTNDRKAFHDAHADLIKWLGENTSWNDFASSLMNQYSTRGSLSENQIAAATRMMEKTIATRKAKEEATPSTDISKILELFAKAKSNGLQRPALRIADLKLSPAPATGRNAGHLYVKNEDYLGKVTPAGKYFGKETETVVKTLSDFAADPMAAAKAYGRRTGSCACCGRTLTNHDSIAAGIGPICASNWGL